ncbi:ricin-like [Mercurialis annua]|uniref:ricin-like n=1 Tax=Mercurialis annua TaxID=3986 RepID=UPI00215E523F|nr:ricin-like [Mercurialis annua]XP_050235571.1 ricin-like [Mercurialis annua]
MAELNWRLQTGFVIIIVLLVNACGEGVQRLVGLIGVIWLLWQIKIYYKEIWQAVKVGQIHHLIGIFLLLVVSINVALDIWEMLFYIDTERLLLLIWKICCLSQLIICFQPRPGYLPFPPPSDLDGNIVTINALFMLPKPILETFTTENATQEKYKYFIKALRNELAIEDFSYYIDKQLPAEYVHIENQTASEPNHVAEIQVMRDGSTFSNDLDQRVLYVKLSTSQASSVTLVLDKSDAYVLGYEAQKVYYLLKLDDEKSWIRNVIQRSVPLDLGFGYNDLEKKAGVSRLDISMGIKQLESAINDLDKTDRNNVDFLKAVAKALIVCITMIPEAARFNYIEKKVCESIVEGGRKTFYKEFQMDEFTVKLQNDWKHYSDVVQKYVPHLALIKYAKKNGDLGAGTSSSQQVRNMKTNENRNKKWKGKENGRKK